MDQPQLDSILAAARRTNEAANVTGLLLYHDGSFFQTLEGPKESVIRIFSAIERDHRHSRVIVLQTKTTDARAFPNWSMGFMNAHTLRPDQAEYLVDLRRLVGQQQGTTALSASPAVSVHINAFLGSFREFAEA
jgi:hypothetical protein